MMSQQFFVVVSVGLVCLQTSVDAHYCSRRCGQCCPSDSMVATDTGDCTLNGVAQCRFASGVCAGGGTASVDCAEREEASITVTVPSGVAANAGNLFAATSTFMYNDIDTWTTDLPHAQLQNFPVRYIGSFSALTPNSYTVPKNAEVKYHCPSAVGACDVVVFIYECHPCPSKKGDLPASLLLNNYERTRCAPTFTTGANPVVYQRMTGYVKQILGGTDEIIVLPDDVEFVVFGLSNGGSIDCSAQNNQADCEHPSLLSHCAWKSGSCSIATCIPQGPSTGCPLSTCVFNNLP